MFLEKYFTFILEVSGWESTKTENVPSFQTIIIQCYVNAITVKPEFIEQNKFNALKSFEFCSIGNLCICHCILQSNR